MQHTQPDADTERQQPFLRRAGQLTQRVLDPLWQPLDAACAAHLLGDVIYGSPCGPPSFMDFFAPPPRPPSRLGFSPLAALPGGEDEPGGPPSIKFYELRDNLPWTSIIGLPRSGTD